MSDSPIRENPANVVPDLPRNSVPIRVGFDALQNRKQFAADHSSLTVRADAPQEHFLIGRPRYIDVVAIPVTSFASHMNACRETETQEQASYTVGQRSTSGGIVNAATPPAGVDQDRTIRRP